MSPHLARKLLRRALAVNAGFSGLSALVAAGLAPALAEHLALPSSRLVGLGVQLAVFASLILILATRPRLERRGLLVAAGAVSASDLLWAAGSVVALAGGLAWTPLGLALVAVCAAATAALGALQGLAVVTLWRAGGVGESDRGGRAAGAGRTSRARRAGKGLAIAGGIAALFLALYLHLPWSDLRSDEIRRPAAAADRAAAAARGRELLRASARVHGLDIFRSLRTVEVVAVDEWSGSSPWWPAPAQRYRAERLPGTFTSRVELLDGPGAGQVWGLQSWRPYRRAAPGGPLEAPERDLAITFYLPTLQYFDELPFRLLAAPVVQDAGIAEIGGERFDRVFVTWERAAPHGSSDQYEVWLEAESHRLAKVAFTLRDAPGFSPRPLAPLMRAAAIGTLHYEDYREVGGMLLPFRQTITVGTPGSAPASLEEGFAHRIEIESVRFDTLDPAALRPFDGLPEPADRKPA